jgi:hypothetical protein
VAGRPWWEEDDDDLEPPLDVDDERREYELDPLDEDAMIDTDDGPWLDD